MKYALINQRGASALSMLIAALFFGSLLTLLIRLGPAYLDNYTLSKTLANLDGAAGLSSMTPEEVRGQISRRMTVNNIHDFDLRNIKIEKDGDLVRLTVNYETRTRLFGNVDAIMSFDQLHELRGR